MDGEKITIVTGASDDIIQVNGEIIEEFNSYDCKDGNLAFSDGTLLDVEYDDDGIWRFKLIYKGILFIKKIEGSVGEDTNDEIYFDEGLKWVLFSDDCEYSTK